MPEPVSLGLSAAAVAISATTAWLSLLRPGRLRMTRPTLFYLGPDGGSYDGSKRGGPKVFVRMLLYSTAKQGNLIENMYVTVRRGETRQNFNIWVYRADGHLSRGSGLYVDQEGVAFDHHFLLPNDGSRFMFNPGHYTIEIYATLARSSKSMLLGGVSSHLPVEVSQEAEASGAGVFFDWGPDLGKYHAHTGPVRVVEVAAPMTSAMPVLDMPQEH